MAKEDIQWAVLGILILIVVALVIKPMATGEPPNIGLPTATPTPLPTVPTYYPTVVITPSVTTDTVTVTPTPVPTWDKTVQNVGFVNPSTYGISLNQSLPNGTSIPAESTFRNTSMVAYATFSGQYSGTTQVINIPFPYWELWYTVDPITTYERETTAEATAKVTVRSTLGVSVNAPPRSYSGVMPAITIQVNDAMDPNRIVRVVTPPGTIDPTIWTPNEEALKKAKTNEEKEDLRKTYSDPRPWKEKFFEGRSSYFFTVKTTLLKSYKIDIMVPSSYVGKY